MVTRLIRGEYAFNNPGIMEDLADIDYRNHANEKTLELLSKLGKYHQVPWGFGIISDEPMVSFGYEGCSGLAVTNHENAFLSHIYSDDTTEHYIDGASRGMASPLRPFIFASVRTDEVRNACHARGLHSVEVFSYRFLQKRDIIVIPRKEIIVVTDDETKVIPI